MALGGNLTDHYATADSTCTGLSNPYNGTVTLYRSVLPVTLLNFNGKYFDNAVTLSWSTEGEVNTKYFTIERSADQVSFQPLTNIAASVNAHKKNYTYIDNASLQGTSYYRLKIVDADNRFTYSKTIVVDGLVNHAFAVFPNPVKDKLFIRLAAIPVTTEIIICDAKGKCVKKLQLKAATTEASVNTADLPAGVYSISLQWSELKNIRQFIKQ
jgi:hypothetical protein